MKSAAMPFIIGLGLILAVLPAERSVEAHSGTWYMIREIGANIRSCPSWDCAILGHAKYGTSVKAFGHKSGWLKFRANGIVGWYPLHWFNDVNPLPQPQAPPSACVNNTWGQVVCAPGWIADAIFSAAGRHDVDPWLLLRVAACESNFNPYVVGAAGEIGIFQFMWGTFYSYSGGDIYNTWDQADTAARMFSMGLAWHWACYYRI